MVFSRRSGHSRLRHASKQVRLTPGCLDGAKQLFPVRTVWLLGFCRVYLCSATWEKLRVEREGQGRAMESEDWKQSRLAAICSALAELDSEMEYQSSKATLQESLKEKLIECAQYDEAPYRALLGET